MVLVLVPLFGCEGAEVAASEAPSPPQIDWTSPVDPILFARAESASIYRTTPGHLEREVPPSLLPELMALDAVELAKWESAEFRSSTTKDDKLMRVELPRAGRIVRG